MIKLENSSIKNWVFVTGAPRTGTTFVGMNLSLPLEVDYIHEPFNPQCGLPGVTQWYRYVKPTLDTEEMQKYHQLTQRIFTYDFKLRTKVPKDDPWHKQLIKQTIGSRGKFYLRIAKINPFHNSAIIKDPIGCLMCEYLYVHFGVKPVIIVKHPASFVASIKRVDFKLGPDQFSDQPYLIQDYFKNEVDFLTKDWSDPLLATAALWRVIYKVLLEQSKQYPNWKVITHEQLSQEPILVFKQLYEDLSLPWSKSVENKIVKQTQGNKSAEARKGRVQDFKRNSADIFKMRRESLTLEERKSIFEMTEDVALQIYSRESFDID
ncbi:sulfotransferase family protein [Lyngbya sp. PCC 8106]|uniref:sulfotransferase family protein n=1 Tax=Lyngbya sp. (strain PCC 8106) TaxID=313612 RepID=UPI0000EAB1BF|nr:sulfotransferase family protein [Lyngbya sp. PCC 8106]EAW35728.1 hypothetical protein L8106_28011 [Lyngbya sp. PCC 8106]